MTANKDPFQVVFVIDEYSWLSRLNSSVNVISGIRDCVLKCLNYFQSVSDCPNRQCRVEWGFKFFNSSQRSRLVRDRPRFAEFKLDGFEDFENELDVRSNCSTSVPRVSQALPTSSDIDVFDALKITLQTVIHDFPWDRPSIESPVKTVQKIKFSRNQSLSSLTVEATEQRNFVFIVCDCMTIDDQLITEDAISTLKAFLPNDIRREIVDNLRIRLFWIDIGNKIPQNIDEGLRTVGGRLIPAAVITNPGTPTTVYIESLFTCVDSNCRCQQNNVELTETENSSDLAATNDESDIMGLPAVNIFSANAAVDCYVNPKPEHEAVAQVNAVLLMNTDLDVPMSRDFNVLIQPLLVNAKNRFTNAFSPDSLSLEPVTDKKSLKDDAMKSGSGALQASVSLTIQAVADVGSIPVTMFQHDDTYIVAGNNSLADSNRVSTADGSCASFEDLVVYLSKRNQTLVIECLRQTSHQLIGRAILRPLTISTAFLSFLSENENVNLLTMADTAVGQQKVDTHSIGKGSDSSLIDERPSIQATNDERKALNRFFPGMLEPWYKTAGSAAAADAIIRSLPPSSTKSHRENERKLMKQLRLHYASQTQESSSSNVLSPRTKRYLSRHASSSAHLPVAGSLKVDGCKHASDVEVSSAGARPEVTNETVVARQIKAASSSITPKKTKISSPVAVRRKRVLTPRRSPRHQLSQRGYSSRKTPQKSSREARCALRKTPRKRSSQSRYTPRKTPSKRSHGYPASGRSSKSSRKSTHCTPAKSSRHGGKRTPAKAAGAAATCRAKLILQKSREAMAKKNSCDDIAENSCNRNSTGQDVSLRVSSDVKDQFTTTGWNDISNEEELVNQLKLTYDKVLEGEGTPLIGVKSIVSSAIHFYTNCNEADVKKCTAEMLCKHILLKMSTIQAKYKERDDVTSAANKFTEFQLQLLLRMEVMSDCRDMWDEEKNDCDSSELLTDVVKLLQAMLILKDPGYISSYLYEVLLDNYFSTVPRLLYNIYIELVIPVPSELEYLTPVDENDNNQQSPLLSSKNLASVLALSASSSTRSASAQAEASQPKKFFRSATFHQGAQRQIQIPAKKPQVPTPVRRSTRIASASKSNRKRQAGDVTETAKVRRMLFNGSEPDRRCSLPVHATSQFSRSFTELLPDKAAGTPTKSYSCLKRKVVAETPAHKQGNRLEMKLALRQKRLSCDPASLISVAESPVKFNSDIASVPVEKMACPSSSSQLRRDSFYSGKLTQNTSVFTKLEQRMTQRTLSPPPTAVGTVSSNYIAGSFLTSPRRVKTTRTLFSAILSPSPDRSFCSRSNNRAALNSMSCERQLQESWQTSRLFEEKNDILTSPSRNTRRRSRHNSDMKVSQAVFASVERPTSAAAIHSSPIGSSEMVANETCQGSSSVEHDIVKANSECSASVLTNSVTMATPKSKGKRPEKTPDSIDKWPRRKNRALMGCSPPVLVSTSSAEHQSSSMGVEVIAVDESERQVPTKADVKCMENSYGCSSTIAVSKSEPVSAGNVPCVEVTGGHGGRHGRKRTRACAGVDSAMPARSPQKMSKVLEPSCLRGSVSFKASSTIGAAEVQEYVEAGVYKLVAETEGNSPPEFSTIADLQECDLKNLKRSRNAAKSAKLSAKSHGSSVLSSFTSSSERSVSPVFSYHAATDSSRLQIQSEPEEMLDSIPPSPVFNSHVSSAAKSTDELKSAIKLDRSLHTSAKKSFSPDVSVSSLIHLITSPMLNATSRKDTDKTKDSGRRSSTRRCLEIQLGSTDIISSASECDLPSSPLATDSA